MSNYHFIGIGGIGMSALARILKSRGAVVQGSDSKDSYITEGLKKAGIEVFASQAASQIGATSTVIYGSAIKPQHPEYAAATIQKLPILHRSELLASLMQGYEALLVAGTHGKTTTSSLLAHVLQVAKLDPTYALGGVACNYSTNGYQGKGRYFVAEADESDGTFLRYQGLGGIITNVEEEHLDFWKNREALIQGFKTFASQISTYLLWCKDDPILSCMKLQGMSYGFSPDAGIQITNWNERGWSVMFDLQINGKHYYQIEIPLLGKHNVLNSAAVFGLSLQLGIPEDLIREAFQNFQGVKRRMERKGEKSGVIVLDDYAHHPTEIKTTLEGLRKAAGEKRVIAVFQPHRYSRLKDCWDGFLESFHAADVVFVTDVYGAGETPIKNMTGENITAALQKRVPIPVFFSTRDQLLKQVGEFVRPHDVIITLGAGDITDLGSELIAYPIKPFRMAVLQGGKSAEHEVALLSANMLTDVMNPDYYKLQRWTISKKGSWMQNGEDVPLAEVVKGLLTCDLVFPILHGPFGEDGMLQGFLETIGVPYAGCDFRSCVVSMDKGWTKHIAQSQGIAVARFFEFSIQEWVKQPEIVYEKILSSFQFPFYVKAVHLGSTFGVYRVKTKEQLIEAIKNISQLDYHFLVEEEVQGRELEFGFIGDHIVEVSDAAEVVRAEEVHTYENKYAATGNPSIPKAALPPDILQNGRRIAETVYRAVGCSGLARIDFFLKPDGTWVLNEVNPMPGFTPMSVYPAIWKAEGLKMTEVVDRIVIASLHRTRRQQRHLRLPERPPIQL